MQSFYNIDNKHEIGVDEVGRGCLFGRLYTAAVILPKDGFDHGLMQDSKKIKSKKKMHALAEYIKTNCVSYSVTYVDETQIDRINILQADLKCMHMSIRAVLQNMEFTPAQCGEYFLLIDGDQFKILTVYDEQTDALCSLNYATIQQGDGKYSAIAAASILAKHARDTYIAELCAQYPELCTRYSINTNMGYGTKTHMDGIHQCGYTQFHRKTFRPCSTSTLYSPVVLDGTIVDETDR